MAANSGTYSKVFGGGGDDGARRTGDTVVFDASGEDDVAAGESDSEVIEGGDECEGNISTVEGRAMGVVETGDATMAFPCGCGATDSVVCTDTVSRGEMAEDSTPGAASAAVLSCSGSDAVAGAMFEDGIGCVISATSGGGAGAEKGCWDCWIAGEGCW